MRTGERGTSLVGKAAPASYGLEHAANDLAGRQSTFHSAFEFLSRVPVSRLTFVPDARVWELIR